MKIQPLNVAIQAPNDSDTRVIIWRFSKIGIPPVLIHFHRIVPNRNYPAIGGTPMT